MKKLPIGIHTFSDIVKENYVDGSEFESYDVDNIYVTSLLFQTGYLTVKKINEQVGEKTYFLSYPNREVRESFLKHILQNVVQN